MTNPIVMLPLEEFMKDVEDETLCYSCQERKWVGTLAGISNKDDSHVFELKLCQKCYEISAAWALMNNTPTKEIKEE